MLKRIPAVLASCALLGASLYADNWPAWRGPRDAGVSAEKNLPVSWSETDNIAWTALLRGLGVSSPVVWGDRVFATSEEGAVAERSGTHPTLVTGAELASSGERTLGGRKQGERARPDDHVRFIVTALDRQTGRKLWDYAMDAAGKLPEVHEKHNLASPSPVTDG